MLEKTFDLIKDLKPGTYVPDNEVCFDAAEINALIRILQRLLYAPSQIRRQLQKHGVNLVPSDFYSDVPTIDEISESFAPETKLPSYDLIFNQETLARTLALMNEFAEEFDPPENIASDTEFHWGNSQFSYSDALSYYCMIRLYKPHRIAEIGSGFSTLVALAAVKKNGSGKIVCVEPYPRDFLKKIDVELVQVKVQNLTNDFFNERLSSNGDFLFIDSTHTVKHGSDCLKIYLGILPSLLRDVYIHAHDIFLPGTFALERLRDIQCFWTEQYLLYAYLLENKRTEVLYGSSVCFMTMREELTKFMGGKKGPGGGSLWFFQRGLERVSMELRRMDL